MAQLFTRSATYEARGIARLEGLDAILDQLSAKFLGGCHFYLANIYDPTDNVGDAQHAGLPAWPDGEKIIAAYNDIIAKCAERRADVELIDMHGLFLGHGIHCRKFWMPHYHADDPHYWYFDNLEDPNDAVVLVGVPVHRREQADAAQVAGGQRVLRPAGGVWRRGVQGEESDNARRVPADGSRDRVLIAGDARDQRQPRAAVLIQFGDPAVSQPRRAVAHVPSQLLRDRLCADRTLIALVAERFEKGGREEVAVGVVKNHTRGR